MQDTIGSVPDVVSRGRDCAAPSHSDLSRGCICILGCSVNGECPVHGGPPVLSQTHEASLRIFEANPVRAYQVEQLAITARQLADRHIYTKNPDIPFCQVCLMSGLNGFPIQHLASCSVGQVLRSIEELGAASA